MGNQIKGHRFGITEFLIFKREGGITGSIAGYCSLKCYQHHVPGQARHIALPAGDHAQVAGAVINGIDHHKRKVGINLGVTERDFSRIVIHFQLKPVHAAITHALSFHRYCNRIIGIGKAGAVEGQHHGFRGRFGGRFSGRLGGGRGFYPTGIFIEEDQHCAAAGLTAFGEVVPAAVGNINLAVVGIDGNFKRVLPLQAVAYQGRITDNRVRLFPDTGRVARQHAAVKIDGVGAAARVGVAGGCVAIGIPVGETGVCAQHMVGGGVMHQPHFGVIAHVDVGVAQQHIFGVYGGKAVNQQFVGVDEIRLYRLAADVIGIGQKEPRLIYAFFLPHPHGMRRSTGAGEGAVRQNDGLIFIGKGFRAVNATEQEGVGIIHILADGVAHADNVVALQAFGHGHFKGAKTKLVGNERFGHNFGAADHHHTPAFVVGEVNPAGEGVHIRRRGLEVITVGFDIGNHFIAGGINHRDHALAKGSYIHVIAGNRHAPRFQANALRPAGNGLQHFVGLTVNHGHKGVGLAGMHVGSLDGAGHFFGNHRSLESHIHFVQPGMHGHAFGVNRVHGSQFQLNLFFLGQGQGCLGCGGVIALARAV